MKKISYILVIFSFIGVLTACGSKVDELKTIPDEKVPSKVTENVETEKSIKENEDSAEEKKEDIWTYYENATYEETWEGLKFNILKVVVSDKAPKINDEGKEVLGSAVGFKIKIENTTANKKYTTYPDQATLITSTGEQVEADIFLSDNVGGDIYEGVIKEGNVIFYLDRGKVEEITWVKILWNSSFEGNGSFDEYKGKEHSVKLDLK